ncbi:hypothetical protein CHS0354_004697 [Potamilus streckersoni]|uniref:MYND-type domain-containing protein n=1 Tax=Potamilus streckersoni TaxID=2493646 RepID=A0AAE0VXL3_9BIVA|nr:hypothetical protein CHS0354_004697 [Potamilus streckersoni]
MSSSKSRCSFCGRKGSVQACNGCRQVAYCSKRCRKKSWTKGHRDSCKSGRQPKQSTPSVSEGYTIPKGHPAAESGTFRMTELPIDLSKLDINYIHAPSGEDDSEVKADETTRNLEAPLSADSFGNVEAPLSADSFGNVEAPLSADSFGNVEAPISEDSIRNVEAPISGDITGNVEAPISGDITGNVEATISGDSLGNAETTRSMKSKGNKQLLENSNTTNFNDEKKQADNEGKKEICFVCSSRHSVKLCGRCKGIPYCSKECQKRDWGRHKQECNKVGGNIETKEYKKQRAQSRNHRSDVIGPGPSVFNPFEFFSFGFPGLYPGMPMDAAQKATPTTPFSVANTIVRGMYPLKQIIDDFNNLPGEYFGLRPPPTNRILLAFITAFYPHIIRHGILIRDKKGEETHVLFYLDNDNPFPFFSWNDIRPGLYICFEEAFFHAFMDGTVGLRIEDASTVTILRV